MRKYTDKERADYLQEWRDLAQTMSLRQAAKIMYERHGIVRSLLINWSAKELVTTHKTYIKGKLHSEKQGLRQSSDVDTEGMQVVGVTTSPYGGKYVKYKKEDKPFDLDAFVEHLKDFKGEYNFIERTQCEDGHLLVIDIADIHLQKLASSSFVNEEYNLTIAKKRVTDGLVGLLNKSFGFNVDQILLVIGNDVLHTDNPFSKTTAGTNQDVDGTWYDAFLVAHDLYVHMIETLVTIADVHVVFNPSNHDYMSGAMLAKALQSWFRDSKNIRFDIDMKHRKYFPYGYSLIGTTHGDGAKEANLPQIMATEQKELWASTKFRYWYCHHLHHKISKDYIGCTVEYLRSPSPADRWHSDNGLINMPACEAFIHSKTQGQVARITHYFL